MSQEVMDAGVDVKVESDDEVEPYDGSYACGFCSESCGARRRSSARSVARIRSTGHVSRAPSMLGSARRVTGTRWRRGGARAAGLRRRAR